VAPNEWRVNYREKKSRSKRKFRSNCKNPFHYCERLHDLGSMRRTVCACSDVKKKVVSGKLPDIRCFVVKYPKRISLGTSSMNSMVQTESFVNTFGALSRA